MCKGGKRTFPQNPNMNLLTEMIFPLSPVAGCRWENVFAEADFVVDLSSFVPQTQNSAD